MSSNDTMSIVVGFMATSAVIPIALLPPILALVGAAAISIGIR